jgi:hypothetical protein
MEDAILRNLDYELGANPVNVSYLTGLGSKRQLEIVHQYAQNDSRTMPPSGIPLGNIQQGISWIYVYGKEPGLLSFPSDSASHDFYPFYDRWSDAFNLSQEFVILHQGRGLAVCAWLMAQSPIKGQSWNGVAAKITSVRAADGRVGFELSAPGLDLGQATLVWEGEGLAPILGKQKISLPRTPSWLEAEAQLPDGRRVFAVFKRP